MSGLDVEALLDSTAAGSTNGAKHDEDDRHQQDRSDRRERDRHRDSSRDRDHDRKRRDRSREHRKDRDEDVKSPRSDRGSINGNHKSRRSSRSRDDDRRSKRDRDDHRNSGGDYYRGSRRSRSPQDDRYYRPRDSGRPKRDRDETDTRDRDHKRSQSRDTKVKTPEPQLTEDERDRRTVFVQQLAARLRTKELIQFFEKVGPVKEAQIVKDRVSGRSKG